MSRYSDDFFESETDSLGDDFVDSSKGITPRVQPVRASSGNKNSKTRIKPMPDAMAQKFPGLTSAVMTFEGGRQVIYLRRR